MDSPDNFNPIVSDDKLKILMIEDNPADGAIIDQMLKHHFESPFELIIVDRLSKGFRHLEHHKVHLILLDLSLPDSVGIDSLIQTRLHSPDIPVIVLTGLLDEEMAVEAVKRGAQDYLLKDAINPHFLRRSIHYAIERHRLQVELQKVSRFDDLTQLYNRRTFFDAAQRCLEMSSRKDISVIFIDIDRLKEINDTWGHTEGGDIALKDFAELLRRIFRKTDQLGRIGGDEFVVMAMDATLETAQQLIQRLKDVLSMYNTSGKRGFRLDISCGVVQYDPESMLSLEKLLSQADNLMYKEKREKQN